MSIFLGLLVDTTNAWLISRKGGYISIMVDKFSQYVVNFNKAKSYFH